MVGSDTIQYIYPEVKFLCHQGEVFKEWHFNSEVAVGRKRYNICKTRSKVKYLCHHGEVLKECHLVRNDRLLLVGSDAIYVTMSTFTLKSSTCAT